MFSLLPILCFTPLLAAYAQSTTPTPPHAESTNVTVPSLDPRLTMPWSYFYFDSMSDTDQSTLQVTGIFPNGTAFLRVIAATTAPGSVVSTTMPFNGKNGIWPGIGGWNASGSDGAATWVTDFSTPSIKGHITLQQSGPSRYSCGVTPPTANSTSTDIPPVSFAASASATFTLGGETFSFNGIGYVDTNTGPAGPLSLQVDTWYWGHGEVGDYTFEYFSLLPKSTASAPSPSIWYTSGYVSTGKDGNVSPGMEFCIAEPATPMQQTNQYLSITNTGEMWTGDPSASAMQGGVQLMFQDKGKAWAFNITPQAIVLQAVPQVPYSRWTASVTGGEVVTNGTQTWQSGKGMIEMISWGPTF